MTLHDAVSDRAIAIDPDWKAAPRLWGHSLHALCSYVGSFPPALIHSLVCRLSRPGDVVADPFSGRGTVALEACIEGRVGFGGDLNPLAHLLTSAKVAPPSLADAGARFLELRGEWRSTIGRQPEVRAMTFARMTERVPPEIGQAFHQETVVELAWLRDRLDRTDPIDRFLLAALAGALHGKGPSYLTNIMPNAVSRSRGSTREAALRRGHALPRRSVFGVLARKLDRSFCDRPPRVRGLSTKADARVFGTTSARTLADRSLPPIRLVITSPPYLGVLRYGQYNWLRMWLIGSEASDVDRSLDEHGIDGYVRFMNEVLINLKVALAEDAVVALFLGDVRTVRGRAISGPRLAESVWLRAAEPAGYTLAGSFQDAVLSSRKVTRLWGPLSGGALTSETVLLLAVSRSGAGRARSGITLPVLWPDRSSIQRRARALHPDLELPGDRRPRRRSAVAGRRRGCVAERLVGDGIHAGHGRETAD